MATIVQQLTWELKRKDLEALLKEAGPDYTALQFKMCIDAAGKMKFLVCMSNDSTEQTAAKSSKTSALLRRTAMEKEACPVPPGCD